MPKTSKSIVKVNKPKLTPDERSKVAKERWAKRRGSVEAGTPPQTPSPTPSHPSTPPPTSPDLPPYPQNPTPEQPPVSPESKAPVYPGLSGSPVNMEPFRPAAQLTPVRVPKQKRYTGPKEFSVALKAAEGRLAKAIVERAQAAGQLAALQAEIPSLLGIIQALKGSQVSIPSVPYDFGGYSPNAQAIATPMPTYPNPVQALQSAQPQIPASRAQGGAIQFSPDVVGALEGPDDDDMDKFITGPAAGGSGWIGG